MRKKIRQLVLWLALLSSGCNAYPQASGPYYSCSPAKGDVPHEIYHAQRFCEIWDEQWGYDYETAIILFFNDLGLITLTSVHTDKKKTKVNVPLGLVLKEWLAAGNPPPAYVVALHNHPYTDRFSEPDEKWAVWGQKTAERYGTYLADFFIIRPDKVISGVDRGLFDEGEEATDE